MYEVANSKHNGHLEVIQEPETVNAHPKDLHPVTGEQLDHE